MFTVNFILKDKKIIFSRSFCTFLLEMITSEGRLGKKTGKGIYDWSSGSAEETNLPE